MLNHLRRFRNTFILRSDFLVRSLNVSLLCSVAGWGIFVEALPVSFWLPAFIAAGVRKKFTMSAFWKRVKWAIHPLTSQFFLRSTDSRMMSFKNTQQRLLERTKETHSIFVACVQYVNCVLLGNNATFHNKISGSWKRKIELERLEKRRKAISYLKRSEGVLPSEAIISFQSVTHFLSTLSQDVMTKVHWNPRQKVNFFASFRWHKHKENPMLRERSQTSIRDGVEDVERGCGELFLAVGVWEYP